MTGPHVVNLKLTVAELTTLIDALGLNAATIFLDRKLREARYAALAPAAKSWSEAVSKDFAEQRKRVAKAQPARSRPTRRRSR